MKSAFTGVSRCWGVFGAVLTSKVYRCVHTIVTVGLKHARMIRHALITWRKHMSMLPACLMTVPRIHHAENLVTCLLTVKDYATDYGGLHTITPLMWTTAQ